MQIGPSHNCSPPALSSESAHLLAVGPVVGGAGLASSGTPQGPNRAWGTGHLPGGQRVVLQLGVQPQPLQSGPPAPSAVPGGAASLGGEMPGPQREPGSALVFSAHLRVRRRGDHSRRTRSEGTSPRAEVKGCPRPLGYAVS